MRCPAVFLLAAALAAPWLPASASPVPPAASPAPGAGRHRLSEDEAREMAAAVARYERIDLSDTHIELNSMDLSADFIPGYASFVVIRESSTPGPDETLRRYAINRRTGDVWEMTLCTHYDFPELRRMRVAFGDKPDTGAADLAAQGRQLGCAEKKGTPPL